MALVTCPDCQEKISDQADSCPHCGRPMRSSAGKEAPQRVKTAEDSVLTRNRGCGDVLIFGALGLILLIVLLVVIASG